ncbi:MAG: hypothetical protein WC196_06935 [Bacilli bacterium]
MDNTALCLVGIIIGVATLFIGVLLALCIKYHTDRSSQRHEIDEKNKKIYQLHREIDSIAEEYPKRDLSKIRELFINARQEIQICGLIAYFPIHVSSEEIINFINNYHGNVRILLANPESEYFINRAENEKDICNRLTNEHKLAIIEYKVIYSNINKSYRSNFKVKLYNKIIENESFQIVDNQEMYVNEYKNDSRGYYSPMYKVTKQRLAQQRTFTYYSELFEKVWDDPLSTPLVLVESDDMQINLPS